MVGIVKENYGYTVAITIYMAINLYLLYGSYSPL